MWIQTSAFNITNPKVMKITRSKRRVNMRKRTHFPSNSLGMSWVNGNDKSSMANNGV